MNPSLRTLAIAVVLSVSLYPAAQAAHHDKDAGKDGPAMDKEVPELLHAVSQGTLRVGGSSIDYTATAGTLEMLDEHGKPVAHFGYTAYVKDGADRQTRPILFAYNGGPGSASMWLHMGILGPQRTVVEDTQVNTIGPFARTNNEFSILDKADLVMIDPVGTGFSIPVGDAQGEDFWGVDNDIESVSNFIARYVSDNGRWQSPKYLLGESYGGIRSGGVAYELFSRHSIALNGVILVSPYMDFIAGNNGAANDLADTNILTTFAATAWYHETVADRPARLEDFLAEAEAFVENSYAPLLRRGASATPEARQEVLRGLERFTGISADYWDRANLRMSESRFTKELLRDRRKTVGRIDSRFVGDAINHIAETFRYDPFFPAVGPAFMATFNDYYREELGVKTARRYIGSAGLYADWDQRHQTPGLGRVPIANTGVDLAWVMSQNPNMRLLVQQGYYDLATPYGAMQYFLNHMDIPPKTRDNITVKYYEAGHMMYVHPESMGRFATDLREFVRE
ncbi:MAG: carboxypeptidase [Pseudomonadota bacterium]